MERIVVQVVGRVLPRRTPGTPASARGRPGRGRRSVDVWRADRFWGGVVWWGEGHGGLWALAEKRRRGGQGEGGSRNGELDVGPPTLSSLVLPPTWGMVRISSGSNTPGPFPELSTRRVGEQAWGAVEASFERTVNKTHKRAVETKREKSGGRRSRRL